MFKFTLGKAGNFASALAAADSFAVSRVGPDPLPISTPSTVSHGRLDGVAMPVSKTLTVKEGGVGGSLKGPGGRRHPARPVVEGIAV